MSDWHCPLCGCRKFSRLFDGIDPMIAVHRTFAIVQCHQCSLFSLMPRPRRQELLSLYPQDYEPFWGSLDEEPDRLLRWMRMRHYAIRCRLVRRARPTGGRLLDVGCGTGGFLHELCRDGNWQGMGVDINERALDIARRQGVNVLCGELSDVCLPKASFDAVAMWDVIEHVPDPQETLAEIHRILKPEGVLLLSAPNGESWQARFWGNHWAGWDIPRHLQIFSPRTLRQLLENTGFEVVRWLALPMERFYAVESARRWLKVRTGGLIQLIAQRLTSLGGLAGWPVFRLIDHTSGASCIILEVHAVSR